MSRMNLHLPWTTFTVLSSKNRLALEQQRRDGGRAGGGFLHPSGIWKAQQSPARASVEAVLSGWLEVDVRGLHLLGLRVPYIFESLPFGAYYLVVNVSDQLLGGLSGNQAMNE